MYELWLTPVGEIGQYTTPYTDTYTRITMKLIERDALFKNIVARNVTGGCGSRTATRMSLSHSFTKMVSIIDGLVRTDGFRTKESSTLITIRVGCSFARTAKIVYSLKCLKREYE